MDQISVFKLPKRLVTLPLVVGLFCLNTLANRPDLTSYEHENPGCQINSVCDKKSGLKRIQWNKIVKTKNIKKINGAIKNRNFPMNVWFIGKKLNSSILWNSICHAHKGKFIHMGKHFVSSAKSLNKFGQYNPEHFVFSDFITFMKDGLLKTYIAPAMESPSSIRSSKMVYTLGEMGDVYTISIDTFGHIQAINADNEYHPTYSVKCPKELMNKQFSLPKNFPIKLTHYCRSIWNESSKVYDTVMVHSFCP